MPGIGESATDRASRRAIAAACVGNAVEWYDFAIYGALATVVGVVFFPANDLATALSAAFAVYGTALIVRPLGALAFGRLGDTRGRRTVLVTVILLMTGATAGVGLLRGTPPLVCWRRSCSCSFAPHKGWRPAASSARQPCSSSRMPGARDAARRGLADRDDGGRDRDGHGSCGWALLPVRRGWGGGPAGGESRSCSRCRLGCRPLPSAPGG